MNAASVQGLQSALLKYSSDKIKERAAGHEQIREILGNRDNLLVFQETAARDGGAGWLAFFQCLFQVVKAEKKALLKKTTEKSGPADRRLADAISIVRWMAERTVHLISRKPFISLFTHMVHLLVYGHSVFLPAALDYAKALRALLSYSPHLDNLDQTSWKVLMGICWASALGDDMHGVEDWEDEDMEQTDEQSRKPHSDEYGFGTQAGPSSTSGRQHRATITQHNMELISLIPILLSSSAAPLIPPMPTVVPGTAPVEKVGYSILLKIHRFFLQYPSETSAHLTILRSLNIVLAALELNCRDDLLSAALKLLPHLVTLWTTRNKAVREQVVIALRTILPFVTHKSLVDSKSATTVKDSLEKLMDVLPKETTVKWGIEALDLGVLRLRNAKSDGINEYGPFELRSLSAGFDFNHEHAMTWAILELYRDVCAHLYDTDHSSLLPTPSREGTFAKRRRVENTFNSLLLAMGNGSTRSRLLSLQVMIFLVDKHWNKVHAEAQSDVRSAVLDLLDEDDENLQSWAFLGVSVLAQLAHEDDTTLQQTSTSALYSPSERLARRKAEEGHWKKAWAHSMRKASSAPVCRAACYAAYTLLNYDKLDQSLCIKDIHVFLQSVDVQGPIYPYDSVCAFLASALHMARSDVRLYALELENRVIAWIEKCSLLDGPRGKGRMEQATPADILWLLSAIARMDHQPLNESTTIESLPDAAIVDRILAEEKTKPIRDFLLHGVFPQLSTSSTLSKPLQATLHSDSAQDASLAFLEGRPRRLSTLLATELISTSAELINPNGAPNAPERIRRCIDLVVLVLSFQASLQLNGLTCDASCVQAAIALLTAVQHTLLSPALSVPAQHLIWRGLEPLVSIAVAEEEIWPILIKPDIQSGIRQDLLPSSMYDSARDDIDLIGPSKHEGGQGLTSGVLSQSAKGPSQIPSSGQSVFPPTPITASFDQSSIVPTRPTSLVKMIWHLPTVAAVGKDLFGVCLKFIGKSTPGVATNGKQAQFPRHGDDDDFGEIRTAETDAMPLSKEALECQRTSASLLVTAIALRLKGSMFASKAMAQRAFKDPSLLNMLLQAEGERFIEIGSAICDAVQHGWLKLDRDAVDLIITFLEEMLSSYAYSRHEALQRLAIDFARCSLSVWIDLDGANLELKERAMYLVCFLAGKVDKGLIPSWIVRLAILQFLDDFLHHDSAVDLWQQAEEVDVDMDEDNGENERGPLAYLSNTLLDIDMRVRIRATTSASSIFYRPSLTLTPGRSQAFYFTSLQKQPGTDSHWDSFVSHMLWKLNVCLASAQQRAAAVFHLYEIPAINPAYNSHLQYGLEAISKRLGLESISALYAPYALVITRSQLREGQMAMRISYKLYGYPSRKAFSAACLNIIGPPILAYGEIDFFTAAAEAAGISLEGAVNHHLPAAAALTLCDSFRHLEEGLTDTQCFEDAMDRLAHIPGLDGRKMLESRLDSELDNIVAHLWESLDLVSSVEDIVGRLGTDSEAGKAFQDLMANDAPVGNVDAVDPSSSISAILPAHNMLKGRKKATSDPKKMVFSALLRLTYRINQVFLISEQRRYLRALALLLSLHPDEMRDSTILQAYLKEMLALLPQPDICGIVLSMVAWGFGLIQSTKIPNLTDLFIGLGTARATLASVDNDPQTQEVGDSLESWLIESASVWRTMDTESNRLAFEAALSLWPTSLRERLNASRSTNKTAPLFVDLRTLIAGSKVKGGAELCKQYAELLLESKPDFPREEMISTFVQSSFWHLKGKLGNSSVNGTVRSDGIKAFLHILYMANGQIHVPPLESMTQFSTHQLPIPPIGRASSSKSTTTSSSSSSTIEQLQANLRIAIVKEVVDLTNTDKQETRAMAYKVLQGMLPMLLDSRSLPFPPDIASKLSVLVPISLPGKQISTSTSTTGELLDKLTDSTWIKNARSVNHWSRELVQLLCELVSSDDAFYRSLEPLVESKTVSLKNLLPHMVRASLTSTQGKNSIVIGERSKALSEHFSMVVQWPSASIETIQSILDIHLYLRYFIPPNRPTDDALAYNAWLETDYLVLSQAAVKCGAFASAMMFLELARDQERVKGVELSDPTVQNIMYEIYSNVEDPDGFYGIQNHDVRDALLRRLGHEGRSQRAFGWNGAAIETSASTTINSSLLPALHNLHEFGFNRLASAVAAQSRRSAQDQDQGTSKDPDPFFFELAWRTGDWDLPLSSTDTSASTSQGLLYSALRAVHRERDSQEACKVVRSSLNKEMDRLSRLGMEQMAQVKKTASNLLCLRLVDNWLDPTFQMVLDQGISSDFSTTFASLDQSFDFSTAEKMTATKLSLLHAGRERESKNMIGDLTTPRLDLIDNLERSVHLRLGELARENGNLQASVNTISAIQQLQLTSGTGIGVGIGKEARSDEAEDAFSHVLWAQGEHALAIQHVGEMVQNLAEQKSKNGARLAVLQGRIAHWTSLAKLKAAHEIKVTFDEAHALAKTNGVSKDEHARLCHTYAVFADGHYMSLSKSPELERLKSYHSRKTTELRQIEATLKGSSRRESSSRAIAMQEVEEDAKAIKELENERRTYIKTCLKMYASALTLSDSHDDSITRLCSLWLEHDNDEDVNRDFSTSLRKIPTHKFVFLGPQLAARLYKPTIVHQFNSALNGLMLRISRDHPFHILYQVITLAHGIEPSAAVPSPSARRKSGIVPNGNGNGYGHEEGRGPAASEILQILQSDDSISSRASRDMKLYAEASITWAHYNESSPSASGTQSQKRKTKPKAGSVHILPNNFPFKNLKLGIPIPTALPKLDLTTRYIGIPTFLRFKTQYSIAGGVHRPKIMACYDTNKKVHGQLFKAEDEVRQDAVMEQVFTLTNDLLSRDRQAKTRDLRFRTYVVVPLPERTGIIEFVEGTKGIGEWLKPAHQTYRPQDLSPSEFQKRISDTQDKDPNSPELIRRYLKCKESFQPIMRHFFTEKHRDPLAWFAMRLNYARSLAVTSIVGWMVGLGDRHCSNILIDQTNGELVHIDFGIVFEDGRKLRIPEKVPFRLTADLVDGLGISGVEGTFRQSCSHTLRVLRDSSGLIMTVLEVFKHDPLYAWAGDPDKLLRVQGKTTTTTTAGGAGGGGVMGDPDVSEKADKVLSKIKSKLGTELSVEYTVNMLVQEARDVENLAKIYHGWAAWF